MKKWLKKIIPEETRQAIREVWDRLSRPFLITYLQVISTSGILSSLHYAFVSRTFDREHRGVLRGRLEYLRKLQGGQANVWLLRRNTHRLEKGLIMRPRRGIFALDYIGETLRSFEAALGGGVLDSGSFQWSKNVLAEYFSVTTSHPKLDGYRTRFQRLTAEENPAGESIPYQRGDGPPSVGYVDFLQLCRRRRSVRWYLDKPVPRELLDRAIVAARQSPSACNRQPFEFRIFDDPQLIQKVAVLPSGTVGFSHQFPCMIVLVGALSAYYHERDRHVIYIDGALAAMSFMLALETLGLSSCSINWPDIAERERAMTRALNLRPDERVVMCLSVGFPLPDGLIPFSEKKPLDNIRNCNCV